MRIFKNCSIFWTTKGFTCYDRTTTWLLRLAWLALLIITTIQVIKSIDSKDEQEKNKHTAYAINIGVISVIVAIIDMLSTYSSINRLNLNNAEEAAPNDPEARSIRQNKRADQHGYGSQHTLQRQNDNLSQPSKLETEPSNDADDNDMERNIARQAR